MTQISLINFLNSLESKGLLANGVNTKIQDYLDYNTKNLGKLFLIFCGLIGAIFISAGVFSIISYNWDDLAKPLKGALSIIPTLVALYFYYLALFKHKNSTVWIETSSLFLMLMIGASIALVSQTYHLEASFENFVKVWLVLTLPLFYLARASGIAIFYLGLTFIFLIPGFGFMSYNNNENYMFFWIFFIAYLPHFFMVLNKDSNMQSFRGIYLGWLTIIALYLALPFAFQGGLVYWAISFIVGFYLLGKKYYSGNMSFLGRPFQTMVFVILFHTLLNFSNEMSRSFLIKMDNLNNFSGWALDQTVFYFAGLIVFLMISIYGLRIRHHKTELNRYILFLPVLIIFSLIIEYLNDDHIIDMRWLSMLIFNLYVIGFGINAMIQGQLHKTILYMIYGLFLVCALLWMRYFDFDYSFWIKGLFFIGVGAVFFLINYLSNDEFETE